MREEGELGVAVGDFLVALAEKKRDRVGGFEGEDGHAGIGDSEHGEPRAAADHEERVATPTNPARAMRGRITGQQFDQARAEVDLPGLLQPLRLRLGQLADALGDKDYLEGRFTVGDLMMADVLRIIDSTGIVDEFPTLKAYKLRCESRPAFQRAMQAQMEGFAQAA
mgnify:CR=1 FL=1